MYNYMEALMRGLRSLEISNLMPLAPRVGLVLPEFCWGLL